MTYTFLEKYKNKNIIILYTKLHIKCQNNIIKKAIKAIKKVVV